MSTIFAHWEDYFNINIQNSMISRIWADREALQSHKIWICGKDYFVFGIFWMKDKPSWLTPLFLKSGIPKFPWCFSWRLLVYRCSMGQGNFAERHSFVLSGFPTGIRVEPIWRGELGKNSDPPHCRSLRHWALQPDDRSSVLILLGLCQLHTLPPSL